MEFTPIQFNLDFDSKRDAEILAMMKTIYPALNEEQLIEAKENLESYLKLAWRIAERLEREAEASAFDNDPNTSYDTEQRSNPNI